MPSILIDKGTQRIWICPNDQVLVNEKNLYL